MKNSRIKIVMSPHLLDYSKDISNFQPFVEWIQGIEHILDSEPLTLECVQVTDIDFFGKRIGFVKAKAHLFYPDKTPVPGIVFLRGGSVSVLVLLQKQGSQEEWVVLTQQPRIPVANMNLLELPAGMLDASGDFIGVAAQELKEECGIDLDAKKLIDLTSLALESEPKCLYPSPGGCDEFVKLFMTRKIVSESEWRDLEQHLGGLHHEGERIRLKLIPKHSVWKETRDFKVLASLFLQEKLGL